MSRHLHFESLGGASGDMILGALIGLGVSCEELNQELQSLNIDPFNIIVDEVVEQGMGGIRARVEIEEKKHDHHGRHLSTIIDLINSSLLHSEVKKDAIEIFNIIGKAEAEIHGIDIEKIHFHEVGAMDSIIDIVGCCLAKHKLGIQHVSIRSLPSGHGTIECAHGTYPNPAPATLLILKNFPTTQVDEPHELVTPTGAALLAAWRTSETTSNGYKLSKTAYSFGHRSLNSRPNLLRASVYENSSDLTPLNCQILECNLDDTTPELIGLLTDKLFEHGALDVFTQPILMKKQRPATMLSVLTTSEERNKMLELIFTESTTFGVRYYDVERDILDRSIVEVKTKYGNISIKIGKRNGDIISASPEINDCKLCAEQHGVAVEDVYRSAIAAWDNTRG